MELRVIEFDSSDEDIMKAGKPKTVKLGELRRQLGGEAGRMRWRDTPAEYDVSLAHLRDKPDDTEIVLELYTTDYHEAEHAAGRDALPYHYPRGRR